METTIKNKTILLSKKGLKELKKAILQLEHDRQEVLKSLREINRSAGREESLIRIDKLSELESVEAELNEKRYIMSHSQPLPAKRTRLQVAIGSIVELIDRHGQMFRYMIVDSVEADPSNGKISTLSPLGQSLVGKTVKEVVKWSNGPKTRKLKLINIK